MLNLQIYIYNDDTEGHDQVELFQDESITITQSLQDVKDIQKVFTDYSRSFSVPASKKNNKIFKHFYNYHITGFDAQRKHKAKLYLNNQFYKDGYIKLEGATTKDNKASTYKITFYGSGVVLKEILQDDIIGSLGMLNAQFTFDYTSANILSYLKSGLDIDYNTDSADLNVQGKGSGTLEDAIIVPLITHTKRLFYNDSTGSSALENSDQYNNLWNDTSNTYDTGLELQQLKPAIKVLAIIKAIEAQYGEQGIIFSDDFFSEDNPVINNLYLWLHTKTGELFTNQDELTPITNFLSNKVDLSDSGEGIGKVHNDYLELPEPSLSSDIKKIPVFCQIEVTAPSNEDFSIIIRSPEGRHINGITLTPELDNGNHVAKTKEFLIPKGNNSFFIYGGSTGNYEVKIRLKRDKEFSFWGDRTMSFEGNAGVGYSRINASTQLPEIKILDFLTGLFKVFNLTSYVDKDGKINVQTIDQFYNLSGNVYDVTEYLDKDSSVIEGTLPYKKIEFGYEGTDSFLAANHKEQFGYDWGSVSTNDIDLGQGSTRGFTGEDYSVKVPFEHFKYEKLRNTSLSASNTRTDIQWGWSANKTQEPYLGKPLLFYAVQQSSTRDIKYVNIDNTDGVISAGTNIYMPSNSLSFSEDSVNLNFNAEQNEFFQEPFTKTLFNEYYKNYIQEVFDSQRRLTKTQAFLPLSVLLNINLNDTLKIGGNIYRINNLVTNYSTLLSKLELINTTSVVGKLITTDVKFGAGSLFGNCVSADVDSTFADNSTLKADCSTQANNGIIIVNNGNQFDADSNTPDTADAEGNPVIVTPATIFDAHVTADSLLIKADSDKQKADQDLREVTSSSWRMGYQISELGKIDNSFNLDQYGFLFSTTQSDVEGTDVDDIAAVSSVTDIKYETQSNNKRPATPFNASYQETNATSATTYYVRFYARTNTGLNYAEADVISEIETITTT
jgi:hypothetical protein